MKGVEVFIDESGDFGPYDPRCPNYIVTMVFHESDEPLFAQKLPILFVHSRR